MPDDIQKIINEQAAIDAEAQAVARHAAIQLAMARRKARGIPCPDDDLAATVKEPQPDSALAERWLSSETTGSSSGNSSKGSLLNGKMPRSTLLQMLCQFDDGAVSKSRRGGSEYILARAPGGQGAAAAANGGHI